MVYSLFIVIATHNRKEYLNVIISQLISQKNINHVKSNILVIVDGSIDGTIDMLNIKYPQVHKIIGNGNWWWTKCMNEGFKKAIDLGANYVLILNDDVEIENDYLLKLFSQYKKLPLNSMLGTTSVSIEEPYFVNSSGTKKYNRLISKAEPWFNMYTKYKDLPPKCAESYTLSGRGTLIPTTIFNKIGLFDENLPQYGSDDDFVLRARKNGFKVYISWDLIIYNHTKLTSKGSSYRDDNLKEFIKSFFNKYSVNSISKTLYLYKKHGYKYLGLINISYFIIGTLRSYFKKSRKL